MAMALWKKICLWLGVLLLSIGGCSALFVNALSGMCGNQIVAEEPSFSGAKRVVVFQRDCGATTGFSTQLSVLDADEELENEAGNLFSADTNHGDAPSGKGGGPEVRVRWVSEEHLEVQHHQAARVFRSEKAIDGIQVDYATFN
jgi:hypothetical protein